MTQGHLNGVPLSMSALSPNAGELSAFSMNVGVDQAATSQRIHSARPDRGAGPTLGSASITIDQSLIIPV
jgi:hypothetical protein